MPRAHFVAAFVCALVVALYSSALAGTDDDPERNRDGSWAIPCAAHVDGAVVVFDLLPDPNMACEVRLGAGSLAGRCWEVI